MLGALIGDCTGSPYDNGDELTSGMKLVLQKSFDKLEGPPFKGKKEKRKVTKVI